MGRSAIDFANKKIGRLLVLRKDGTQRPLRWICKCDCGKEVSAKAGCFTKKKPKKSCGCLGRDRTSERSFVHGMTGTKIHSVWMSMMKRCYLKTRIEYKHYGGRGIYVNENWHTFTEFYKDVGLPPTPKHQLDRIDNDGPYSKDNCRWSTVREQSLNRRSNRFLELDGVTKCITDWATSLNITDTTLRQRLERGWSLEKALTTKKRKYPNARLN